MLVARLTESARPPRARGSRWAGRSISAAELLIEARRAPFQWDARLRYFWYAFPLLIPRVSPMRPHPIPASRAATAAACSADLAASISAAVACRCFAAVTASLASARRRSSGASGTAGPARRSRLISRCGALTVGRSSQCQRTAHGPSSALCRRPSGGEVHLRHRVRGSRPPTVRLVLAVWCLCFGIAAAAVEGRLASGARRLACDGKSSATLLSKSLRLSSPSEGSCETDLCRIHGRDPIVPQTNIMGNEIGPATPRQTHRCRTSGNQFHGNGSAARAPSTRRQPPNTRPWRGGCSG